MPSQRHDLAVPGHALALALAPITRWKSFKYNEGTKDEVVIRPMTKQQLHDTFGHGSRRVRHHSTRPKFQKSGDAFAAASKSKVKNSK